MLMRKDSDSYITNLQVDDALDDVSTEFSTPIKNCPSSDLPIDMIPTSQQSN